MFFVCHVPWPLGARETFAVVTAALSGRARNCKRPGVRFEGSARVGRAAEQGAWGPFFLHLFAPFSGSAVCRSRRRGCACCTVLWMDAAWLSVARANFHCTQMKLFVVVFALVVVCYAQDSLLRSNRNPDGPARSALARESNSVAQIAYERRERISRFRRWWRDNQDSLLARILRNIRNRWQSGRASLRSSWESRPHWARPFESREEQSSSRYSRSREERRSLLN